MRKRVKREYDNKGVCMRQNTDTSRGESENIRTGNSPAEIKQSILDSLYFSQARIPQTATLNDWYMALSLIHI